MWGMNNMPVGDRRSETLSHPINMMIKSFPKGKKQSLLEERTYCRLLTVETKVIGLMITLKDRDVKITQRSRNIF
jgi:hypothetical protein